MQLGNERAKEIVLNFLVNVVAIAPLEVGSDNLSAAEMAEGKASPSRVVDGLANENQQ